jgi:hypothetical protein
MPALPRGRRDLGKSIVAMIDYDRADEGRRDRADTSSGYPLRVWEGNSPNSRR